ncbi:UNVERIFIED_CONTAM: hypothetical protein GTU68_063238 [Idotea baltica]|nr:hypothetical protein [Idotea baltica]
MIELENSTVHSESNDIPSSFMKYENEILYDEFFRNNLEKNKPCLFGAWLTQNWLASSKWVSAEGTPNCEYLSHAFGEAEVPVANCNQKHFDSHDKKNYILKEYLKYFKDNNERAVKSLYLKDWHFTKEFPTVKAYETPSYFGSDWLNEFWSCRSDANDDYRFVYIGPKESWTPLHTDVFRSFSWSSNICGRKRWVFFAPSDAPFLNNKYSELAYDVDHPQFRDPNQYPKAHLAQGRVEVIQESGETIFVPSNWHHQVWNLQLSYLLFL